ncbi:MAG: hypothetical protein KAW12_10030 [Candidatus Aminicenantes bacterium]|nr:hypothetical protein [Candidatus Aminicenantes bacterium]
MKKMITILILSGCLITGAVFASGGSDMTKFFPAVKGMKKGKPDIYTPDNLYEYINGAAEIFLGFDFQELAALTYEDPQEHQLTIDIYRHSSARNGFGIYSQEKPVKGDFLKIGAQGYYEKGVLNFVKGSYYVKISGFDLGDKDKEVMTAAAEKISKKLVGADHFPLPTTSFPGRGKIVNSERFTAADFLGHSFLHSAFAADYKDSGTEFQIFIMEAATPKEARKIVENYFKFAKKKNSEISAYGDFFRFLDPYYRSKGQVNIRAKGKYVFGLFGDDMKRVRYYMDVISGNLANLHSSH